MKLLKSLLVLLVFQFSGVVVWAQFQTTIPLNSDVRYGKLKNGMTYYLLHNEEPKERASFYFVQNVGAILEEDSQNGLAHFLEHMAFNGTQHFKGKGIINFLEKHGVAFGGDINAYTAKDQTVYNLSNVPVKEGGLLDSCLMVLHDWSSFLLLDEEEIDAERGVIREEWRTRRNARFRLMKQTSQVLFHGSKYAERDVIGDLDVINNFKYQTLRDYYKKWYRPDLQAVVVVGDLDVEQLEKKVKEVFGPIPLPKDAVERPFYSIPDNEELLFCQAKDKEAKDISINLLFKKDMKEVKDEKYLRKGFMQAMFRSMLSSRFRELLQKSSSSSIALQAGFTNLCRTKECFYLAASPKQKQSISSFQELMTEMERVVRFGFTSSELERTKVKFIRSYESYYQQRDKISNDNWAQNLGNHFLEGEPVLSVKDECEMAKEMISSITLADINNWSKGLMTNNNRLMTVSGPEKEGVVLPVKQDLLKVLDKVKTMELAPYQDDAGTTPLVSQTLKGGKVKEKFNVEGIDAKGFVLENGARIVVLPTKYNKDQVLFRAFSWGGMSLLPSEDLASAATVEALAQVSGVGNYDATQLRKKLAGKLVRLAPSLANNSEGFKGSASPQDLETLMQLIYLQFEAPRFDKDAFTSLTSKWKTNLVNMNADNSKAFRDSINVTNNNNHSRVQIFNEDFLNSIDFAKAKKIYKDRFQDASDFTFLFVGNVDMEKMLPMVEKYLGSISSSHRAEKWVNHHENPAKGKVVNEFTRKMEVAKTSVYAGLFGKVEYNRENRLCVQMIAELLDKRYMETIREAEGGSYGVSVRGSVDRIPEPQFQYGIFFDCDPAKQQKLREIVASEIQGLIKRGPIEEDLNKIKENFLKNHHESLDNNSFWLYSIQHCLTTNEAFLNEAQYEKAVKGISAKQIQRFARKAFKHMDQTEVVMNPKVEK